jgi:predicted Zn-dependent protease
VAVILIGLLAALGVRLWATAGARRWRYERQPVETLRSIAEHLPGDPVLRLTLGRKLLAAGQAGEAAQEFRRAATLDPHSAEALAGLGAALAASGHEGDAFGALQLSLNQRPTPEALRLQGQLLLSHQASGKAVPILERAVRLAPDDPTTWRLLAEARADAGQWSAAEAAWSRVISLHPNDRAAQIGRARALIQLGRPAEAEPLLRAVLRQEPASVDAHTLLGAALAEQQPAAEFAAPAEAAFREALRLDGTSADAAYGLSLLLLREGRSREALPLLTYLVRRHPDALRARFQHARALRAVGRTAEADQAMLEYHRRAEAARLKMELRGRLTLRPNDRVLRARLSRVGRGMENGSPN